MKRKLLVDFIKETVHICLSGIKHPWTMYTREDPSSIVREKSKQKYETIKALNRGELSEYTKNQKKTAS